MIAKGHFRAKHAAFIMYATNTTVEAVALAMGLWTRSVLTSGAGRMGICVASVLVIIGVFVAAFAWQCCDLPKLGGDAMGALQMPLVLLAIFCGSMTAYSAADQASSTRTIETWLLIGALGFMVLLQLVADWFVLSSAVIARRNARQS